MNFFLGLIFNLTYAYIYIHTYTYIRTHIHVYIYPQTYTHSSIHTLTYIHISTHKRNTDKKTFTSIRGSWSLRKGINESFNKNLNIILNDVPKSREK